MGLPSRRSRGDFRFFSDAAKPHFQLYTLWDLSTDVLERWPSNAFFWCYLSCPLPELMDMSHSEEIKFSRGF